MNAITLKRRVPRHKNSGGTRTARKENVMGPKTKDDNTGAAFEEDINSLYDAPEEDEEEEQDDDE